MTYDGDVRDSKAGRYSADYDVPHVWFRRTANGFEASWNRTNEYCHRLMHGMSETTGRMTANQPKEPSFFILIFQFLWLGVMLAGCAWWAIDRLFFGWKKITVDRKHVMVVNRKMTRAHFGHFDIHHVLGRGSKTYAVLGYSFANRRYAFGGVWPVDKAQEVASALNVHLRNLARRSGDARADNNRGDRPQGY